MQYRYINLALLAATAAAAPLPQTNTNFPFDLAPISIPPAPATPLDPVLQIVSDGPDLILGGVTQALTNPADNGTPDTGITGVDNTPIGGVVEAVETQAAAGQAKRQSDGANYLYGAVTQSLTNPAENGSPNTGITGIDNTPFGGIIEAVETQAEAGQVKRQNDPSEVLSNAGNYVAAGVTQSLTNPAENGSPNTGIEGIDNTPFGGIVEAVETQAEAGQVKRQNDQINQALGAVTQGLTDPADSGSPNTGVEGIDNTPFGGIIEAAETQAEAGQVKRQFNQVASALSQGLTNPAENGSPDTGIEGVDNTPIGGIIEAAETQAEKGEVKRQTGVTGIDNSPIGGLLEASGLDQVVQGTNQVVNLPAIINE